jgi:hypothetical protein
MIEKALIVIIAMYALSLSVIGVQYEANKIGITITNMDGVAIESQIVTYLNQDQFNQVTINVVSGNYSDSGQNTTYYDRVETFTTGAAFVAWELVTLLSGTYIFNFLYLMGIPYLFVAGFVMIYLLLLSRAIIGLIRGI